jgi:transposase
MKHFIGIDNSSLSHKVCVINEHGKPELSFEIDNNYLGFQTLNRRLKVYPPVGIAFELPHGPIVDFLKNENYTMYSINPLKIKRFKESTIVSGNKNDDIDSNAIALYLQKNHMRLKGLCFNSPDIEKLKTLSIIHTRLTNNKTRHLNKLHFAVRQYFPLQDTLFSSFGCKTQLKLLIKYPKLEDLKSATDDEIRECLISSKYRRPGQILNILDKIHHYEHFVSHEIELAYAFEALCLCKILLELENTLKAIEKEMNHITKTHPKGKCFFTLPGASTVLASKLLAIFGDNENRFSHYRELQCLFGTAPKNYQSGNYHKVMMRKACNKYARTIMYCFSFASIRHSAWAREYYDKQRSKGKTHSVAIRALSNKWMKVIFKIWIEELFYNEELKKRVA